jgi:hypothetical protein
MEGKHLRKKILYYNSRYWCIRCVLERDTIRAVGTFRKEKLGQKKGQNEEILCLMKRVGCFFWCVGSFSIS